MCSAAQWCIRVIAEATQLKMDGLQTFHRLSIKQTEIKWEISLFYGNFCCIRFDTESLSPPHKIWPVLFTMGMFMITLERLINGVISVLTHSVLKPSCLNRNTAKFIPLKHVRGKFPVSFFFSLSPVCSCRRWINCSRLTGQHICLWWVSRGFSLTCSWIAVQ